MCVVLHVCCIVLYCLVLYCIACVLYCIACVLYCMCVVLYVCCIVCVLYCMCVVLYVCCIVCVLYCQHVIYCSACRDNLVFVMSDCPHSSEDLAAFFYLHAHLPTTQLKGRGNDTKGVFLSEGLSAQLKKCSLSLHWVDTTPLQGKTQVMPVAVLTQD